VSPPSPARLRQARDLAGVGELAQAHTAEAELPEHRAGPAAATAAGVAAHLELGLRGGLVDQCLLCHLDLLPLAADGATAATALLGSGGVGVFEL
jgi:hypothetical protein